MLSSNRQIKFNLRKFISFFLIYKKIFVKAVHAKNVNIKASKAKKNN